MYWCVYIHGVFSIALMELSFFVVLSDILQTEALILWYFVNFHKWYAPYTWHNLTFQCQRLKFLLKISQFLINEVTVNTSPRFQVIGLKNFGQYIVHELFRQGSAFFNESCGVWKWRHCRKNTYPVLSFFITSFISHFINI